MKKFFLLSFTLLAALVLSGVEGCAPVPSPASTPIIILPTVVFLPTPTLRPLSLDERKNVFEATWALVNSNYVYPDFNGVNWQKLHDDYAPRVASADAPESFYALMQGMINSLNDYGSSFQSPQVVAATNQAQSGGEVFGGVGFTYSIVKEGALVTHVLQNAPGDLAGLKAGDIVVAIDGFAVSAIEATMPGGIISQVRGPAGTIIHLTVRSPDGKSRALDITRAMVVANYPATATRLPGTQVGFLTILTFNSDDMPAQVITQLQKLSPAGPLNGLIIDVRGTGPGTFSTLGYTLALFNDGGVYGKYVGRDTNSSTSINVPRGGVIAEFKDVPIVVLSNDYTRGAGELFPLGMQVLKRARIVGIPTQGTAGNFAQHYLSDGSRVYIWEQAVVRPDGTPIRGKGVQPDRLADSKWYLYMYNPIDDPVVQAALEELKKK